MSMQSRIVRHAVVRRHGIISPVAAARRERSVVLLRLLIFTALSLGIVMLLRATPAAAAVAPGAETSEGGVLMQLQYEMLALKGQLKLMMSAFPDLLSVGPFIASRLTKNYDPNFIWTIVLYTIGIFSGASLVEVVLALRLFRPLHQLLPDLGEQSDFGKLGALLVHGLIRLIELSAFGLTAIVLFLFLYQGHEAARYAFWTLFSFVMIQRAAAIGWRLVLSPYLPSLRLPALDDGTARRLYRHFQWVTGLTIGSELTATFLYNIGLAAGLTLAACTVLASLGTIVIIAAISRDRRAIGRLIGIRPSVEGAMRHDLTGLFAAHWHIFAICLAVAVWIIALVHRLLTNEVHAGRVFATLSLLVIVPLVDGLARLFVRHFFGESSGEADSQSGPAIREAAPTGIENAGFDGVILRNVRIALAVVATILIGRIWHISLSAIGPGALGPRIAEAMFQIIVTLLLASSAWSIIKIAINRHAPHETLDALALLDDSDAGTGVSRLETLLPLIRKFLFVTIVAIVLMSVVSSLGVNIGPLLAGAGIVGIAVGFGAQTLVRDILSGIFFLIDDAFRVGEYIDVGEARVPSSTCRSGR